MARLSQWPLWQLTLSRLRIFYREPAAVFWVYGFPLVMAVSLGMAFRDEPQEQISVDLIGAEGDASGLANPLGAAAKFKVNAAPQEDWRKRLQAGKTDVVIEVRGPGENPPYQLWDEPHRTESRLARYAVEAALLRGEQAAPAQVRHLEQAGSRYIDFLLPGLIGMNLMGGGMWGVGFVIVDMRVRKLLKRFLATPMRRSDFLMAVMFSRLFFMLTDIAVLLFFGYAVFGVRCQGSYLDLCGAVIFGGTAFAGIGLLVASRAQTIETVSGVMNFVMLPMWIFSGVFFSSERFPSEIRPLIDALPLTALNQALRGVMLEGKSLLAIWSQLAILTVYTVITFAISLRYFRWR